MYTNYTGRSSNWFNYFILLAVGFTLAVILFFSFYEPDYKDYHPQQEIDQYVPPSYVTEAIEESNDSRLTFFWIAKEENGLIDYYELIPQTQTWENFGQIISETFPNPGKRDLTGIFFMVTQMPSGKVKTLVMLLEPSMNERLLSIIQEMKDGESTISDLSEYANSILADSIIKIQKSRKVEESDLSPEPNPFQPPSEPTPQNKGEPQKKQRDSSDPVKEVFDNEDALPA